MKKSIRFFSVLPFTYIPTNIFRQFLLVLFLLSAVLTGASDAAINYVDGVNGDNSNLESIERPFRTIERATKVIGSGDIVYLREGGCHETISMEKSGAKGAPIVFKAYQDEHVVVTGAGKIQGWVAHQDGIYQASASLTIPPEKYQVFVNGRMVHQAREPDIGDHNAPFSKTWLSMRKVTSNTEFV